MKNLEIIKSLRFDVTENKNKDTIENFGLIPKGYYLGSSDQWRDEHVSNTNSISIAAKKNNPSINEGDLFYRCPKLSLPREKMNIVNERYKTKTTRNIDKANWIITSQKYLKSLIDTMWDTLVDSSELAVSLKSHAGKNGMPLDMENKLIKELEDEKCFIQVLNNYYYHNNNNDAASMFNRIDKLTTKSRGYQTYIHFDNKDTWDFMIKNEDIIITDSHLNKLATEDSLIIDTDTYNSLSSMFKGRDTENYTLGMEIMSNCNVEESKGFLALLFFRFEIKFREAKSWNHINFKTIRDRFEKYTLNYSRNHVSPYNQFIEHLIKENGLTIYVMEAILDTVYEQVIEQSFGIDMNTVFELNRCDLKLKDEYVKKCIDKNIGEVLKEENKLINMDLHF